ncbi:hypothetical protein [Streptomyces sp. NPDC018045]|uniref:hypothetical protein n=1 Tax=Streptomyces sp. NPDC018045 TaxID=3365037 RepID=UPI00379B632F
MHPPQISTGTWWIIAVIMTAMFLAVCVPLMPTRKHKINIACVPLLGVGFLTAAANLRGHDVNQVLAIYSTVMFALPLGVVGRGKDIKKAAEEQKKAIGGQQPPAPFKLTAQLLAATVVGLVLFGWVNGWFVTG